MYEIKTVYVKTLPNRTPYQVYEGDLVDTLPIIDTLQHYEDVVIKTYHTVLKTEQSVTLQEVMRHTLDLSLTLKEAFIKVGDKRLTHLTGTVKLKTGQVIYKDVWRSGFEPKFVDPANGEVSKYDSLNTWLSLERAFTNYKTVYEYLLVSINGFLHRTDYDVNRFYVIGAKATAEASKNAQIGLYSFEQIGKIIPIPIKAGDIVVNDDVPLYTRTIIKTQQSLKGKTVGMSIGGYLHLCDPRTVRVVGDNLIEVQWCSINLIDRLLESRRYLDLSSLPLTQAEQNPDIIHVEDLKTNEFIQAYLTLNQSFIFLVDTDGLYVETEVAENAPSVNHFYGYRGLPSPMITNSGKLLEYWDMREYGVYSYYTPDAIQRNYEYKTAKPDAVPNVDDKLIGAFPSRLEEPGFGVFKHIQVSKLELRK